MWKNVINHVRNDGDFKFRKSVFPTKYDQQLINHNKEQWIRLGALLYFLDENEYRVFKEIDVVGLTPETSESHVQYFSDYFENIYNVYKHGVNVLVGMVEREELSTDQLLVYTRDVFDDKDSPKVDNYDFMKVFCHETMSNTSLEDIEWTVVSIVDQIVRDTKKLYGVMETITRECGFEKLSEFYKEILEETK